MKIVKTSEAKKRRNSSVCTAIEYPLDDEDINCAVIKLSGRYPDKGRVVNKKCKELVYVVEGDGKLVVEGKEIRLKEGDQVLIEPGERYYFKGDMKFVVPCVPAWYAEQHQEVE